MSLRLKLWGLIVAPLLLLTVYAIISRYSLSQLATGRLVQDKDLVADILPPPEYVLEANLVAWQMSDPRTQAIMPELLARQQQLRRDFLERRKYWSDNLEPGQLRDAFEVAVESGEHFLELCEKDLTPMAKAGNYTEARALVVGPLTAAYNSHRAAIDRLVDLSTKQAQIDQAVTDHLIRFNNWLAFLGPLLALVILGGVGFWLIQDASRRLSEVSSDILGRSESVALASAQISSTSHSIAQGTSEQASSLEETSASLEEMSAMTRSNADHAEQAKQISIQTLQAATQGAVVVQRMATVMQDVQQASDGISKIIKTIDEIAFQTNILALNAAVEAARAGEAGAGFAVVAEEVRALAQRSAQAARETSARIAESVEKSGQGFLLSEDVRSSLAGMDEGIRKLDSLVTQIATSSSEQAQGIDQLNAAIRQMDQVTQAAAASTETAASSGEELDGLARDLRMSVDKLKMLLDGKSRHP